MRGYDVSTEYGADPFYYGSLLPQRLALQEQIQALEEQIDPVEAERDARLAEVQRLTYEIEAAIAAREDHAADAAKLDQQLKAQEGEQTGAPQAQIDELRRKDAKLQNDARNLYQQGTVVAGLLPVEFPTFDDTARAAAEARQAAEDRSVADAVQQRLGDEYTVVDPDKAKRGADGRLLLTVSYCCELPAPSAREAHNKRVMAYRSSVYAAIMREDPSIQLSALWDQWDAEREQRRQHELELGLEPFDPGERPAQLPKLTYRGNAPPKIDSGDTLFGGTDPPT